MEKYFILRVVLLCLFCVFILLKWDYVSKNTNYTGGTFYLHAGIGQEIVKWTFTANKINNKTYEVHFTPTVQSPWHIYSQHSPEGGALPAVFNFNKNPLVSFVGNVKEVGNVISKYEDVFEVTVKYFEGKTDFVQVVSLLHAPSKAGRQGDKPIRTNISGTIEFMACHEEQCTPPQKVSFNIPLQ